MKTVGVVMLRQNIAERGEWRDCIDVRWYELLAKCGLRPILIPNALLYLNLILEQPPTAFLLTGGGDLGYLTSQPSSRDDVEAALLTYAKEHRIPVLGICRGMQAMAYFSGSKISKVANHVRVSHQLDLFGKTWMVNSYHNYQIVNIANDYDVCARSEDGVIEMIMHKDLPWVGVGWHPERPPNDSELFLHLLQIIGIQ